MPEPIFTPRFIQIHFLKDTVASLINRDDSGLAKRMSYGGVIRIRQSSQSFKYWLKNADDEYSINNIPGIEEAVRSRMTIERLVMDPLRDSGEFTPEVVTAVEKAFHVGIYGKNAAEKENRQTLLLGAPEVRHFTELARRVCEQHPEDGDAAGTEAAALFSARHGAGKSFLGMLDGVSLAAGIDSAIFGRMVTSDTAATIEASAHFAQLLTVHEAETESDYFTVVDKLDAEAGKLDANDEGSAAAAYLGNTELTSGLFYGYIVLDIPTLVSNTVGCSPKDWLDTDRTIAAKVVEHLLMLTATVSSGAKKGSTAPYSYSELTMVEAGSRQPRSLARAFRKPLHPTQTDEAGNAMADLLTVMDHNYGRREARRMMALYQSEMPGAQKVIMADLVDWAGNAVRNGQAE